MRTPSPPGPSHIFNFKTTADMAQWLKAQAALNHRSVSAEIAFRLTQMRQQQEPAHV